MGRQEMGLPAPDSGVSALDVITVWVAMLSPVSLAVLWWTGLFRRGALARRGVPAVPWWVCIAGAFLAMCAGMVGGTVARAFAGPGEDVLRLAILQMAVGAAMIAGASAAVRH